MSFIEWEKLIEIDKIFMPQMAKWRRGLENILLWNQLI